MSRASTSSRTPSPAADRAPARYARLLLPAILQGVSLWGCSPSALPPSGGTGPGTDTGPPFGDADGDGWSLEEGDCDDTDPSVHPTAVETCDGVDQDCDGTLDEDAADRPTWFIDADGDGWGDAATGTRACTSPGAARVSTEGDCDDTHTAIHPGAVEWCDGLDGDCDGSVDEGADCSAAGGCRAHPRGWFENAASFVDLTVPILGDGSSSVVSLAFPDGGTLSVCPGRWSGLLIDLGPDSEVIGVDGAGATLLDACHIESAEGDLTIRGITMRRGWWQDGGAVTKEQGRLVIADSAFLGNETAERGGAACAWSADVEVSGTVFLGNLGENHEVFDTPRGGALYVHRGDLVVRDSTFRGNTVRSTMTHGGGFDAGGGAISVDFGSLLVEDSTFEGNRGFAVEAEAQGGAIRVEAWNETPTVTLRRTAFTGNEAPRRWGFGGAVWIDGADLIVEDSTFDGNMAWNHGGAVAVFHPGTITTTATDWRSNDPDDVFVDGTGSLTLGEDADGSCP